MGILDSASLSFDWFILALRIAFIVLIYLFLYQVARVSIRELVAMGSAAKDDNVSTLPALSTALEMLDPAESSHVTGTRFPLDHYSTIGRRDDNTIVIDDAFVSGTHAQLTYDHGAWWLQDLGSTNGTAVNGNRLTSRVQLRQNDVVQFGRVSLRADLG